MFTKRKRDENHDYDRDDVGFGGLPRWGYSRNWGYGPSGVLGLVLLIVVVLLLAGYVPAASEPPVPDSAKTLSRPISSIF